MQMNLDYDLAKPLATALKVRAPYVGIPMPGHAPLTFDRKKLSACLKGVKPTNIEVIVGDAEYKTEINPTGKWNDQKKISFHDRWIKVEGYASGGRVRTRLIFKAIPAHYWRSWQGKAALKSWRETEQRERQKIILAPTSPADRKRIALVRKATDTLKRLLREVEKLGRPYPLYNPSVPRLREAANEHQREGYGSLRRTKRMRTIIGGIARQAIKQNWSSQQLYKHLTARGIEFEKMSDMTGKYREMYGAENFYDYLRNLHRFVYGTGMHHVIKPWERQYGRPSADDMKQWGGERYMVKLADIQMRRSLQNQIDSVREILIANGAGPKPVPTAESFEVPADVTVPFTPGLAGLPTSTSIAA